MTDKISLQKRLEAFAQLGTFLKDGNEQLDGLIASAQHYNGWFTPENTRKAVTAIADMLNKEALQTWAAQWQAYPEINEPKKVGLILAGNIPMVGFHDVLSVLMAGHVALIKLSSQDHKLIPYLLQQLCSIEPAFKEQINYVEQLENFDAVIATGSNNSSRYFEYYFSKVPHIIRKNRNSVALIKGDETATELANLGEDIFAYFGLGCRNVSKLYVPEGYRFDSFFEAIEGYKGITEHHKYINNYDYNKSIYLVNGDRHLDNGFLLVKEAEQLASPLAVLYFETYTDWGSLGQKLREQKADIQCIASQHEMETGNQVVPFGFTQKPRLWDYADGINLMDFLFKEISGN